MPSVRIPEARQSWESPVSVPILESAGAVRAALEELGWPFDRSKSTRLYSKFAYVLMVPKGAYVFQFKLKEVSQAVIETWETDISSSGRVSRLKVDGYTVAETENIRRFLELYRKACGRDPWHFTFRERSQAGYLLPEFGRAKRAWASFGFETRAPRAGRKPKRSDP